jgi:hypothetical protein
MSIVFNFALAQKSDFSLAEARLMKEEAMRLWQRRDDQSSLEQSLSNFEKVHQVNTQDLEILTYLARGYYLLANLHLDNEALKMKNFETARLFGELGLMLNPHYRKLIKDNTEMAIDKLTEKEAPILFWTAASLGKWAKLYGIMSSLKYKAQIILMIKKAEQLKPEYFYGAIPRYWGEYYAAIPAIFGTNSEIEKSQKYFKKAMDAAPEYLGTKNLYAQFYLVKKEDKRGFRKTMEEVLKAPNGPIEITPENLLEKLRADKLLEKMDDLF